MPDEIESRIAALETTVRRWRLTAAIALPSLLVVVSAYLIVHGQKGHAATSPDHVPDVLQAREFMVVDKDGVPTVMLSTRLGVGHLVIFNNSTKNREPTIILGGEPNLGGTLTTYNTKGKAAISLFTTAAGVGLLSVKNGEGKDSVVAFNGTLTTYNSKGQELVRLGATVEGDGTLTTLNGKGQELVNLGVSQMGVGVLATFNGKGNKLVNLGVTVEGQGTLTTLNGKGQELVNLGVSEDGDGTLTTLNGKGQELVRLAVQRNGGGAVATYSAGGRRTGELP